jgi:hypothetical protein
VVSLSTNRAPKPKHRGASYEPRKERPVKKALVIGGTLIALYLVVAYTSNAGTLINDSTQGATSVIKAFQGR